jgi:hypothetical protein
VLFETGDKDYYWLNNVVAVGLLSNVEGGGGDDSFLLRIDVWHVSLLLAVFLLLGTCPCLAGGEGWWDGDFGCLGTSC